MEFLGDSILGFVVSEALVLRHPSAREGALSKWKAHLVSATHLHRCALELGLGEYLQLGKGEERNGGRERKTLLANALEALIAALHIDGGIEVARAFIDEHVLGMLDNADDVESINALNFKNVLQERTQALGCQPRVTSSWNRADPSTPRSSPLKPGLTMGTSAALPALQRNPRARRRLGYSWTISTKPT